MSMEYLLSLICLACVATMVSSYSSGAPNQPGICNSMTPGHGVGGQASQSPYTVSFSPSSYTPGGSAITVTLAGGTFKGFLLTAKSASDRTTNVGTFSSLPANTRAVCSNAGVTHTETSGKSTLEFQWTPPASSQGNVIFRATFVQEKELFWVAVNASSELQDSTDGTGPSGTGSETTTQAPTPTGSLSAATGCGTSKGCFSSCNSPTDCDFVISWEPGTSNSNVKITMSGRVSQADHYIAIGLSKDSSMGDDSVMYCTKDGAYQAYNAAGSKSSSPLSPATEGLSQVQASLADGIVTCSFLRQKAVGGGGKIFPLDTAYTLLFATGPGSANLIEKHGPAPLLSSQAASLTDFTVNFGGSADFPVLVKVHGSLMVVAWIFAASLGVVFARYFKNVWEDKDILGHKVWFQVHRFFMVVALLATVSAFVIIFVEVGGYSETSEEGIKKAHPIIGIVVTILTVINPTIALFRPHPGTKNRPIFNWVHWGIGTAAYILGVISIFFGMEMDKAGAPDYMVYILAAFVGWQFLIQILLEISLCFGRNEAARGNTYQMQEMNGSDAKQTPTRQSTFNKQLLITLHCFVVLGFTIAIIVVLNTGSDDD